MLTRRALQRCSANREQNDQQFRVLLSFANSVRNEPLPSEQKVGGWLESVRAYFPSFPSKVLERRRQSVHEMVTEFRRSKTWEQLGNKHCRIPCKTVIHDIGKC